MSHKGLGFDWPLDSLHEFRGRVYYYTLIVQWNTSNVIGSHQSVVLTFDIPQGLVRCCTFLLFVI